MSSDQEGRGVVQGSTTEKLGVPLEDWKQWRTEVNNCLVKKIFTGDPGRGFVPFEKYLDYPGDSEIGEEDMMSTMTNSELVNKPPNKPINLMVYNNALQNQSHLKGKDFLNYGIPRVAMSVHERRTDPQRTTTSSGQKFNNKSKPDNGTKNKQFAHQTKNEAVGHGQTDSGTQTGASVLGGGGATSGARDAQEHNYVPNEAKTQGKQASSSSSSTAQQKRLPRTVEIPRFIKIRRVQSDSHIRDTSPPRRTQGKRQSEPKVRFKNA